METKVFQFVFVPMNFLSTAMLCVRCHRDPSCTLCLKRFQQTLWGNNHWCLLTPRTTAWTCRVPHMVFGAGSKDCLDVVTSRYKWNPNAYWAHCVLKVLSKDWLGPSYHLLWEVQPPLWSYYKFPRVLFLGSLLALICIFPVLDSYLLVSALSSLPSFLDLTPPEVITTLINGVWSS